jgi:hypothetical protein
MIGTRAYGAIDVEPEMYHSKYGTGGIYCKNKVCTDTQPEE